MREDERMSVPARPRLVVFDLAGTTIDDRGEVPASFLAALAAHGVAATTAEIDGIRGASKREAFTHLLATVHDSRTLAERVEAAYRTFQDELERRFGEAGVHAVPGAEETFRWLRAEGIRFALNTGFDRATTELLLAPLGWMDGFADAVVCVDDVEHGRPAPDLILKAIALAGLGDPAAAANVGDTVLDLEAARRARVGWSIGVTSGAHARERLARVPHTHLIASVAELPSLWDSPSG
jgi:phosphonatase-like hydrolase